VRNVCATYEAAPGLARRGTHVISCDEKTCIQAVTREAPTLPRTPGRIERPEFNYVRHGTTHLIANFDVVTGEVVAPSFGPTRDAKDFALHIRRTVASDPHAPWVFVVDNLTTHMSESLVRLVAELEDLDIDLGVFEKRGILKSTSTRRAFLGDRRRRIRFVYTPKHCSWLNQIEIWFSILTRRLLKRGCFASVEELCARILAFIDYFNRVLAKPFRWTYTGRALAA